MLNTDIKFFLMSCLAVLVFSNGSFAEKKERQPKVKPVFEIQDIFKSVRIPNIVVTTEGTVLAFAKSGRLLRRSEDRGESWGPIKEVGPDSSGSAIVDCNSGDVMVVNSKEGYLWRSNDDGKTWKREEIIIKPNAVGYGRPDGIPVQTTCSESGITLRYGTHKGRLMMPARIQPPKGNNEQQWWPYNHNTAIYSDDGGRTWQTSGPVQSGTGEGTLAELSNGNIYYNSRCHMAVDHRRRIAWSYDGGHMWTDWEVSEHLYEIGEPFYFKYGTKPSYGCNAGLVRLPSETTKSKDILLFSTPDNPGSTRVRMSVWASFDGAKTWPVKRLVYEGLSAYSSLAAGQDGSIYLLFERGKKKLYESIAVARFNLEWLVKGQDSQNAAEDNKITSDMVYGHKHGMALTMDVYQPEQGNGIGVLFMVSGGWHSAWAPPKKTMGLFKPLLDKGFTVLAVRHGSSPKYIVPEVVQDVRRSVRFVRFKARELNIDPDRLGVCGFSAGGHLSLVLGTTSDDGDPDSKDEVLRVSNKVAAVVAYCPPTDLRPLVSKDSPYRKHFPALRFDPNDANEVSPLLHASADDPPVLLIHGDKDVLVPIWHSEKMCEALKAKGVESELFVIKGAGHGFTGKDAERASKAWAAWFEKHLLSNKPRTGQTGSD